MLSRRRFLILTAAAGVLPISAKALHVETGVALGARVTLRLDHPDAPDLSRAAFAEIERLEQIFSLYRPDAALARLNRDKVLTEPPFELLDCLSVAAGVVKASGGAFDPSVQPIWSAMAKAAEAGTALSDQEYAALHPVTGWDKVQLGAGEIRLQPGAALTLNGIAQGFIADKVADFLARQGLTHALIDTGEMVAMNGAQNGAWPVTLASGSKIGLQNRALATSSPKGMLVAGQSHIIDPATGRPVRPHWQSVSISAPSAALADALTTAACVLPDETAVKDLTARFPGTRLEAAQTA